MLKIPSQVLQKRVWNQQVYDKHTNEFILGQLRPYLDKNKIAIDVGAAVGMYAYFVSQHTKHVHAIEAVPPVFAQLLKTCEKADNITAYNSAVSNFVGESCFYVDDKRLSNSSFQDLVGGQKIEVDVITIDSLDLKDVGFIKIDTEGTEFDVVEGGRKTIERDLPICMIEVYCKFSKHPPERIFNYFFNLGYKIFYNIKQKGLIQLENPQSATKIALDESMIDVHDGDFLFVFN